MKREAVIAFYHASYMARLISAEKKQEYSIYDNFPLWNEEEMQEAKVEMYKQKLLKSNKRLKTINGKEAEDERI